MSNLSIYIHYPFCKSKCPYCDFNSYCNLNIDNESLLDGYLKEINYYEGVIKDKNIKTIYFGGGTPSLMQSNIVSAILKKISSLAVIDKDCEITIEANPNSVGFQKLNEFHNAGINRISIGIQSLKDSDLKMLGRIHSRDEAISSIRFAEQVFKDKYSIDLIYARPNQKLDEWESELREAVKLSPFHISAYQLIIEKGTPFARSKVETPKEDLCVDMYNVTRDILEDNGLKFYEISNYAKEKHESKHNMVYWSNGEWIGIGAGAHSRLNDSKKRYGIENIKNPVKWLEDVSKRGRGFNRRFYLNDRDIIEEFVLMGLRVKNGITIKDLQQNLDVSSFYDVLDKNNIDFLIKNGFIQGDGKNLKVTKNGFLLLNSIIDKLL